MSLGRFSPQVNLQTGAIRKGSKDPMNAMAFRTQRAENPEDFGQPLYDRVNYPAAGATQLSFFSTPRGQTATLNTAEAAPAAKVKTFRDTNMENANVVPTKLYKFIGLSVAYLHQQCGAVTNGQDRDRLRKGGYLQFRIVDKDIIYLPLTHIPEVNPLLNASTTANNTTILCEAGGGGNNVPMYVFSVPITLRPYENFTFTLNFDGVVALTNPIDVLVTLHALMRRPT